MIKEAEHFRMTTRSRAYVGVSSWSGGEHHKVRRSSRGLAGSFTWMLMAVKKKAGSHGQRLLRTRDPKVSRCNKKEG